ncbi:hypothetical protein Fmac_027396 [Flemingia macrophylla]|uniref:Late embryogenesis abundant protein LEA-2 subgroup domain-containing protein n=1 Tax=Flemingia macrophylla TaxID=520843 RepID=A0ABD1LHM7_9FABA
MADKQPPPNAASSDPSVPPAEQPLRCGLGCCFCLFQIFWILLVCIIVLVVLVILVLYIVIQPRPFNFHVTEARLTQFNYTDDSNTLRYNLVLNFTAGNPNAKLNIYYDKVEGHMLYGGVRVASTDVVTRMTSFRQFENSTALMSGVFSGQSAVAFDASDFDGDQRNSVFHIDVRVYFRIRLRLSDFIAGNMKPRAKCGLRVPFRSNVTALTGFSPTKCNVDF